MSTETQHRELSYSNVVSFMAQPDQALEQLKAARAVELDWQKNGDYWHRPLAVRNLAKLDGWIDGQQTYIAAQATAEQERVAVNEAARLASEQRADDALKAELRTTFKAANPGASDGDFEAVYPDLKQRHQVQRMDTVMTQAKNNPRYQI